MKEFDTKKNRALDIPDLQTVTKTKAEEKIIATEHKMGAVDVDVSAATKSAPIPSLETQLSNFVTDQATGLVQKELTSIEDMGRSISEQSVSSIATNIVSKPVEFDTTATQNETAGNELFATPILSSQPIAQNPSISPQMIDSQLQLRPSVLEQMQEETLKLEEASNLLGRSDAVGADIKAVPIGTLPTASITLDTVAAAAPSAPILNENTLLGNTNSNVATANEKRVDLDKIHMKQDVTTDEPIASMSSKTTGDRKSKQTKERTFSWKKAFFLPMAGTIAGAVIFAGGYHTIISLTRNPEQTPQQAFQSNNNSQSTVASGSTTPTTEIIKTVSPGVVTVLVGDELNNLAGNGSGVVYKSENNKVYILTNSHVVDGAGAIEVYRNDLGPEKTDVARVIGQDKANDIAILELNKPTNSYDTAIKFADTNNLQVGQKVIAIGSPYVAALGASFSGSVTEGIISGLDREVQTGTSGSLYRKNPVFQKYIQTDAAINGGNSGGALIDTNGHLVGINSAKISGADNVGLAIPANSVSEVMKELDVPLPDFVS